MVFEFSAQRTFLESIDIIDIGNTALRCSDQNMNEFYLITKTVFGKTAILKFGGVCPDIDALLDDFTVSYKKIDYRENKISSEISKFINDPKRSITSVEEITEYELWHAFPQIQQLYNNL